MTPATPALPDDRDDDGRWVETGEQLRFTLAGFYIGAARFRCVTLLRPLGRRPYPITPSLLALLPQGVRALHIPAEPIAARFPRISRFGNGVCYVPGQGKRFFIDLTGSFEDYLGKFTSKTRATLRRKMRKLARISSGSLQWREFCQPEEITEFGKLASQLSRKTYQHRLLHAGLAASHFYPNPGWDCCENDARGYILFHGGTPISYLFCRERSTDLVIEKMGFDSSFASYSPGAVLHCLVLESLFSNDRFKRLDLGPGEYSYKSHLATASIETAEIFCFPWSLRNVLLIGLHYTIESLSRLLRSIADSSGFGQKLRKVIRHGSGRILGQST